jgi:hypothetical protein
LITRIIFGDEYRSLSFTVIKYCPTWHAHPVLSTSWHSATGCKQ